MLVSANFMAPGYAWPDGFPESFFKTRDRRLFNSNVLGDILHFRPVKRNDKDGNIGLVYTGPTDDHSDRFTFRL